MDTFARDHLPPRSAWPDLTLLGYPERLNAGVELPAHEGVAVRGEDGDWSYDELRARADGVAAALAIEPGTRVLLHAANSPMAIAAWLGILRAGGVVVATMPLLRAGELKKVIDKARVSHALVDGPLTGEVAKAGSLTIHALDEIGPGSFEPVDTAADDVAIIAFTSGTTGVPKGCMHLHRDLLATCDTFAKEILDPQPDEVFSGTPPLAFTYGLGGLVLFPLRFGASTVPVSRPGPEAVLEAIRERRITTLFTAPTAYRGLLRTARAEDLAPLRTCVSAGEPLPAGVAEAWTAKTGLRIVDGIGSTEMLHIFIAARSEEARPGSCGRPVPGYEARIVGPKMQTLAPGEVGRLAVRGPTGCRYLDDERQSVYVVDGWNLTGDAFSMDEDGYFWFQARTDDMIVSSGYNISGFEVEAALLEHAAVAECAVIAAPDEERGHVVMAYVVSAGEVTAKELQDHVKARIAPYKYPRRVEFVEALPRTPTGKVQRNVLRERVS
jgi:2-aminobenzoate-CoA ligase